MKKIIIMIINHGVWLKNFNWYNIFRKRKLQFIIVLFRVHSYTFEVVVDNGVHAPVIFEIIENRNLYADYFYNNFAEIAYNYHHHYLFCSLQTWVPPTFETLIFTYTRGTSGNNKDDANKRIFFMICSV